MKYIKIQKFPEEKTTLLTISRESALNALNMEVLKELDLALNEVDTNTCRSIIITGKGEKSFVAGADIGYMQNFSKEQAQDFTIFGSGLFKRIERFTIPVIAAVNGYALGGGLELALACDFRIASENAIFGLPELGLGIIPGFGGTQRLMRTIPTGKAKEMIYTGAKIDSTMAKQLGLVNGVYPIDELMEHVKMLAKRIAKNDAEAVKIAKKAMNEGIDQTISTGLEIESIMFSQCFEREEQQNRMKRFLEK
ncbi:enoyl-CoA hydratase [Aequitasia blattaphilus]|uniref:Enoyl-CoA hydratase-related protein n=1 Tax=Aequitasia blattaphilus TaxID=2949332 RepID=A0ABT1EBT9_9FIRM|nr:enoyl-CoA hydratase-related protein [Aequitasia blattaphilus]MCP1103278.1 enoyl-CoA hydratase-related protein [Aequitasia blattaphilus]MCR8615918.1 enoyl-CoA hydratase-related protein [Aequitasia blattaphilus]